MSRKPTVYLDTNIFSALFYSGHDPEAVARHLTTSDWWALERPFFHLWASLATVAELRAGHYPGQGSAIAEAMRLRHLPFTAPVKHCAQLLLSADVVPLSKPGDAFQLAFATMHALDYLLTWNHAHLTNVDAQRKLQRLCERQKWRMPALVSPETIPKAAFGQEILRPNEE